MPELPASVRLALWVTLSWRGDLPLEESTVRALPDVDHVSGMFPSLDAWGAVGERALFVALPRPGDPNGMPRCGVAAGGHAVESGECVYVAGVGGLLVPTLSRFGPEGDRGLRVDWTGYDSDPVPRHRLEMLDLREVERELVGRLREHTERLEAAGGTPWGPRERAEAEGDLDGHRWGLPEVPTKALHVMALASTVSSVGHRALSMNGLGSHGVDVGTAALRERLLRRLVAHADAALEQAANVAVMALAGWRPA